MPSKGVKIKKGDKVEARWKGSRIYYPAIVLEANANEYKVQFDDGTSSSVKTSEIKTLSSDSSEPPRRSRSRGRPRGSSKSPARRSSPSREEKKPVISKSRTTRTRSLRSSNHSDELESVNKKELPAVKLPVEKRDSSVEARSSGEDVPFKASRFYSNSTKQEMEYSVVVQDFRRSDDTVNLRTSSRIAKLQAAKALASSDDKPNDDQKLMWKSLESESRTTYPRDVRDGESDEDESEEEETAPQKSFSVLICFLTLLKVLFLPMFILFFCLTCVGKSCSIYDVPPAYSRWKEFQKDVEYPLLFCAAFHLLLCLLSKIPVGPLVSEYVYEKKDKPARNYRLNGFYLLLLAVMAYSVLLYFDYYSNWPAKNIKPFVISSLIYTTFWSVVIHFYGVLKKHDSLEARPAHRCGFVGDFYFGREVNPRIFGGREDVKTRFIQFGLIMLVLMDLSIVSNFLVVRSYVPVPLVLTVSMHILFVLEFLWREECMLSSATYTEDGVGYGFLVGIGSVIPFSFVLQAVFLAKHQEKTGVQLPHWASVGIVLLFLCGLCIYELSVKLKHNFRKSPFSSSLSKVTSIPTSKKRRLITSGLWGVVRHPNYLGLLIMVIACSLPCGFTHVLPYMPLLFFVLLLGVRSIKLDLRCREKYGPAWQNYTDMVRSRLIPYVF